MTIGICAAVKTSRICVAPVPRAFAASTPGRWAVRYFMSWLLKPHCAADMKKDPPTVRKTNSIVSSGSFERCAFYGLTINDCRSLRQVFWSNLDLRILQGNLSGETNRESNYNLVSYPFTGRRCSIHGVQETTADGSKRPANNPEQRHNTDLSECKSLCDGGKRERNDQGEHSDTGAYWTSAVDALKVDGKVVKYDEIGAAEEGHEE